ncbi:MAG: hypothetical protein Q4D98_06850 [Planctomycetia bacterium]|nr:hypothetical protein [Planctomycetia bacterium]
MDKLKIVWRYIRKYGFWVVSVLVLLVTFLVWKQVAGSLLANYDTRVGEIEGKFSQMQTLSGAQNQPNAKVVAKKEKALKEQSQNVYSSWERLYNIQKAANKWPITDARYLKVFEEAGEKKAANPKYEVSDSAREYYWNYIKERLKKVKEIYDIKRPKKEYLEAMAAENAGQPVRGGRMTAMTSMAGVDGQLREDQMEGMVYWNEANFRQLEARLSWKTRPSTAAILVAQEDLWVYEAILRIIQETNAGKSAFNASVKEIFAIDVAQDTIPAVEDAMQRVLKVAEAKVDGEMMDAAPMEEMPEEGVEEDDSEFAKLFDERYVDANGVHLTVAQLRENPPSTEYKMMPIHLHIMINQRAISQLLVNCVNSSMPVEVLQVSINPARARPLDLSGDTKAGVEGGAASAGRGSRRERRAAGGMRGERTVDDYDMNDSFMEDASAVPGGRGGVATPESGVSNRGPEDVDLELFGIIYIFNRPDQAKFPALLEEESEEESEDSEEVEGEEAEDGGEESAEEAEGEEAAAESETETEPAETEATETEPAEAAEEVPETTTRRSRRNRNAAAEEPAEEAAVEEAEAEEGDAAAMEDAP